MALIPFGEYLPDLPAFENPGATVARNVLPRTGGSGYEPLAAVSELSPALTARCRGAISVTDKDGGTYNYAGDATKLYQTTASAANDVSKVGGYTNGSDDLWEFVKWGNTLIGANWADPVQTITLGGANFSDLITSTRKPRARTISVDFNNFVILGNCVDAVDGETPNRVWWSAQNNPLDFDPATSTQSGKQDIQGDGGAIQRIIPSGERQIIFQKRAIQLMTYVGGAVIFTILPIEEKRGALTPGGVVGLGRLAFYLADDGFYGFDGTSSTPIGAGKVDRTFLAEVNQTFLGRISAAIDPRRKLVVWSYPTTNSADGTPDKLLIYNWVDNRWSDASVSIELLFRMLSQGYTLEDLDAIGTLDDLPLSLDSDAWKGGALQLGAFSTAHKMSLFGGSNLAATVETAEFQMFEGHRALVTDVIPIIDGGTISMQLGGRNRVNDAVTYSASSAQNANGVCTFLSNARYHRARASVAAGGTWSHAQGVNGIVATDQGAN